MAGSKFSLGSILGWFKSFLNSMDSPISGFDMKDVKVNEKGDVFSSVFSFESNQQITDISGTPINYTVLLKALNGKKVLQPLFDGIAQLPDDDVSAGDKARLCEILGVDFGADFSDIVQSATSIRVFADDQSGFKPTEGKGLLGFDFSKGDLNQSFGKFGGYEWSWGKIANDYLVYGLECEVPGVKFGAIENVKLNRCSDLITEYLSMTDTLVSAKEVAKVDPLTLAKPILMNMQTALVKYFSQVADKITTGDKDKESEEANKETEEEKADKKAQAEKDKMVNIYQYDDNQQLQQVDTVDKSTPEGIAQIKEYSGHGFVGEGGASLMSLVSSKYISVTLQKVTGTSEIKLTSIKASYSPSEVFDDLEEIMDQDEFIDTITEEPQTFDIKVDDDGFDIERCDGCQECDPCDSLGTALQTAIQAYRNLYIIHWMASGNDMMKTHLLAEEMYEELIKEIDTLGELMVEKCGTVINPNFPCEYIEVKNFEFQESLDVIKSLIQPYIDALDFAYCNQDSDVQSIFDEWLRYWNKQLNYFVRGQEA